MEIIYKIWRCIPLITDKTASLFIENDIHISDFLVRETPSKEEIHIMKYPSGSIIGKRANKIVKVRDFASPSNKRIYIKMISSIKGISKATAGIILDNFTMEDLLLNNVSRDDIINLKKTSNRNIGKKITNELFRFFVREE